MRESETVKEKARQSKGKSDSQKEFKSVREKARQLERKSESQLYETIREREPNFSQSERKLNCPRKVRQSKRKSDSQKKVRQPGRKSGSQSESQMVRDKVYSQN